MGKPINNRVVNRSWNSWRNSDLGEKLAHKLRELEEEKMQLERERAQEAALRRQEETLRKNNEDNIRKQEETARQQEVARAEAEAKRAEEKRQEEELRAQAEKLRIQNEIEEERRVADARRVEEKRIRDMENQIREQEVWILFFSFQFLFCLLSFFYRGVLLRGCGCFGVLFTWSEMYNLVYGMRDLNFFFFFFKTGKRILLLLWKIYFNLFLILKILKSSRRKINANYTSNTACCKLNILHC